MVAQCATAASTDGAPQDEFVKDQEYRYDANGNRSRDERGDHQFNSRDQHVQWRRSADYGQTAGSIVYYEVNGSGAIAEKDDDGITTRYKYSADRLLTATTGGSVSRYHYDPFGNVKKIENGSEAAGLQLDEFERMTKATGDGTSTSEYEYDGLDRRDSETTDGKTQDFAYVGTTDQLSQERDRSGSKTEDYDYDATEDLVGRATGQVGAETQGSYKDFGKDVNGSVQASRSSTARSSPATSTSMTRTARSRTVQHPGRAGKGQPLPLRILLLRLRHQAVRHASAQLPPGDRAVYLTRPVRIRLQGLQSSSRPADPEPLCLCRRQPGQSC